MNSESQEPTTSENKEPAIGRNEPCPCGSGKKYKRCCGVSAAPKLGAARPTPDLSAFGGGAGASAGGGTGGLPFDPSQLDPQWMQQFGQALQRLPRGQMQRLQALVQKAMAGKDVSREAADLERILPADLQNLIKGFSMPGMQTTPASGAAEPAPAAMTEDEARAIVERAAAEGKVDKQEAEELLAAPVSETASEETRTGLSKLWRSFKK